MEDLSAHREDLGATGVSSSSVPSVILLTYSVAPFPASRRRPGADAPAGSMTPVPPSAFGGTISPSTSPPAAPPATSRPLSRRRGPAGVHPEGLLCHFATHVVDPDRDLKYVPAVDHVAL